MKIVLPEEYQAVGNTIKELLIAANLTFDASWDRAVSEAKERGYNNVESDSIAFYAMANGINECYERNWETRHGN